MTNETRTETTDETTVDPGDATPGMTSDDTTLTAVLAALEHEGYTASFGARDGARLRCSSCRAERAAAEFHVDAVRRLEGTSDPDAEVLVVAATCPSCGARGTVAFGYGPEASAPDAEAVAALVIDPG